MPAYYTKTSAAKIIDDYNALRDWALEIVSDVPYDASPGAVYKPAPGDTFPRL